MLTIDEIQKRLVDRRIPVVASITGLHHNTVTAIRDGKTTRPSMETIQKLSDYLSERNDS